MSLFREEVVEHRRTRLHGEIVLSQPISTRILAGALFVTIAIASLWLVMGTYARIETVPGTLITDVPSAKIIATAPGVVTSLTVTEGQLVKQGDVLAIVNLDRRASTGAQVAGRGLDAIEARSQLAKTQMDLSGRRAAAEANRLNSLIRAAQQQSVSLREQIALQEQVVHSNEQIVGQISGVVDRGFISKVEFERRRQTLMGSQQALAGLRQQLTSLIAEAGQAQAQLATLAVETAQGVSDLESSVQAMALQRAQLEGEQGYVVSAPVSGRVTALQTAEGRTTSPNLPLMVIVPDGSQLRAELYAPTRSVGFVHEGQETRILYDAFPYTRFGSFGGKVKSVSRTAIDPRESDVPIQLEEPVYRITVTLDRQSVSAHGENVRLQPGMALKANIVLERQTFLQWLLQPLNAVLKRTA